MKECHCKYLNDTESLAACGIKEIFCGPLTCDKYMSLEKQKKLTQIRLLFSNRDRNGRGYDLCKQSTSNDGPHNSISVSKSLSVHSKKWKIDVVYLM